MIATSVKDITNEALPFSARMATGILRECVHHGTIMAVEINATIGPGPWVAELIGQTYVLWRCTKQPWYVMTAAPPVATTPVSVLRFDTEPGSPADIVYQTAEAFRTLYPMHKIETDQI